MANSAFCVFDFTLPAYIGDLEFPPEKVKCFLVKNCKKWCFQLERGEKTGYRHYQGRASLMVKRRLNQIIAMVHSEFSSGHISPTSKENHTNFFYACKEETRIDGPWRDEEEEETRFVPERLTKEIVWKPFQNDIIENIKGNPDDRTVNIALQEAGNAGKTLLSLWLHANKLAKYVPPVEDAEKLVQVIMGSPASRCYLFDIPKGIDKKKLREIYCAIEQIKNGFVYDTRYKYKEKMFNPPHVWVFTNSLEGLEASLSGDRIKLWLIEDNQLKPGKRPVKKGHSGEKSMKQQVSELGWTFE